ncbi:MAG TPA: phosphotransferase family protein [Candidatus Binataceae bacterium]|nr:phosphotransferase family protein [Candidatus Binataceae bacterium]
MIKDDLSDRLQAALRRHIGEPGTIHNLQRLTGGANRTTMSFDADVQGRRIELIIQLGAEVSDPVAGVTPEVTTADQARLMMAAQRRGAPAPKIMAILEPADELGQGYISERVAGETLGPRILRDQRFAAARKLMARQCGEILAAIHRIEPAEVPFLMSQDAATHLAAHRRVVDYYQFRMPALELALKWLEKHLPHNHRHTVVHGDFRTGNFIVGEEGIRCVLDWELAQAGDPIQDLGWLCIRTWRFGGSGPVGGFGHREDLYAAYEKASGYAVESKHAKFWEAFGNVKWAIDCLRLGMRGIEEGSIERSAIGRRIEEPLWDFFELIENRE